jgi:hypothetical protein
MTTTVATFRLAVLLGALAAMGCGGGAVIGGVPRRDGGSETEGPASCPRGWTVSDTKAHLTPAVAIADGALTIAVALQGDELVAITHDGALTGDFDVAFDFEAFMPGATAAYLQAAARVDDPALSDSPLIGTGIGVDDGVKDLRALFLYKEPAASRFDLALTAGVTGTMRLARTGKMIVATSTATSGEVATIAADVSAAPVAIGLQFASGASARPTADASVRLTDFRVTGGGGLPGDTFDCDSLR